MIFLVIFVVIPLVELYFMLEVGEVFGAFNTVFLVVLTAIIGGVMVRQQGFSTAMRMRERLNYKVQDRRNASALHPKSCHGANLAKNAKKYPAEQFRGKFGVIENEG